MYLLIAEHQPIRFGDLYSLYSEEVVAKFSNKKAAEKYLKESWLKNFAPLQGESPFRQSSLLYGATGAYIREKEPELVVPIDPKLGEKE